MVPESKKTIDSSSPLDPDAPLVKGDEPNVKLLYSHSLKRIRVELSFEICAATKRYPEDIFERVKKRMEKAIQDQSVEFYVIHDKKLSEVWRELGLKQNAALGTISLTLAEGVPMLRGLLVKKGVDSSEIARISLNASSSEVKSWRVDWLVLHIERKLSELGISSRVNPAQVRGMLFKSAAGATIKNYSLQSVDALLTKKNETTSYNLLHNKSRHEVSLIVYDLEELGNINQVEKRMERIEDKIRKLPNHSKGQFVLFRAEIIEALSFALVGPEKLGIGMPMVVLAAARKPEMQKQNNSVGPGNLGKPLFGFEINVDKMKATVTRVDPEVYGSNSTIDAQWLRREAARSGLEFGLRDEFISTILSKVKVKEDLIGTIIAEGMPPSSGKNPYLLDIGSGLGGGVNDGSESLNKREYRQQLTVKAGELIAEVCYGEPPVDGKNVMGEVIKALPGEELTIKLGEGVRKDGGRIYACLDGLFVNDPEVGIYLKKILIHEGDVNGASGNIDFDGPVEINGVIDSGAKVFSGGDLVVHGGIRGGLVRCNGSITVEHGIVGGATGVVKAKGNIDADFVENSTIICGGTVNVTKSILTSKVTAGVGINSDGVISGGTITAGEYIKTAKLGLNDGLKTEVKVGVDVKIEMTLLLRRKRLEAFTKSYEEERKSLKELSRKSAAQLGKANKEKKCKLQARLPKWKRLLERAQALLDKTVGQQSTGKTGAKIYVNGPLSTNCIIWLGRQSVPITQDWSFIVISADGSGPLIKPSS